MYLKSRLMACITISLEIITRLLSCGFFACVFEHTPIFSVPKSNEKILVLAACANTYFLLRR